MGSLWLHLLHGPTQISNDPTHGKPIPFVANDSMFPNDLNSDQPVWISKGKILTKARENLFKNWVIYLKRLL